MALRLCEGLDCTALEQACPGFDAGALIQRASRPELKPFCTVTGRVVALTPQGFLLSNTLIMDLLDAQADTIHGQKYWKELIGQCEPDQDPNFSP